MTAIHADTIVKMFSCMLVGLKNISVQISCEFVPPKIVGNYYYLFIINYLGKKIIKTGKIKLKLSPLCSLTKIKNNREYLCVC